MALVDTAWGHLFVAERRWPGSPVPPLILLHGAGGSHLDWPPALRQLPGVHTLTIDLLGHGRSRGQAPTTIDVHAAAVCSLLEELAIPRAVLVGHSLGGAVAQQMALEHGEVVAGLVLIATGSKLPIQPDLPERACTQTEATVDWIVSQAWSAAAPPPIKALARQRLAATEPRVLRADLLACASFDVRDRLRQVVAPALVLGAAQDRMVPLMFSATLADLIPGAQLVVVEGAGHMLPLEAPAEVGRLVGRWLAEQEWRQ